MQSSYDVIVIGAGHNGLVAATYLAKRGKSVAVMEKRQTIGGVAAGREFATGYYTTGLLHDTAQVRPRVIKDLNLGKFGLTYERTPASVFAPTLNGHGLLLHHDPVAAEGEIAHYASKDAAAYKAYRAFMSGIRNFVERVFDEANPDVYHMNFFGLADLMKKAVSLRLMGSKDMMEILRIGPMCVADWLNEWFETDILKALLAGPAVFGHYTGPWSPSTNANLVVSECMSRLSINGGPQALVNALVAAAKDAGVSIYAGTNVKSLRIDSGRVQGVTLDDDRVISAAKVVSTCDPKTTFLKLTDADAIEQSFEKRIEQYRTRGVTAVVNLGLKRPLDFACRPGFFPEFVRTGEHLDDLERAFDSVKYGEISVVPALAIHVPTVKNPGLAPNGHTVASVLFHYAPYDLRAGWTKQAKEQLLQTTLGVLERYSPGISQQVAAHEVLTPLDLEVEYGLSQGHLWHGEHAIDQVLMRPTPETAQYRTPIEGLFLAGSGSHPGGGITCAPGSLAAKAVYKS